jgi:hypothetical protein
MRASSCPHAFLGMTSQGASALRPRAPKYSADRRPAYSPSPHQVWLPSSARTATLTSTSFSAAAPRAPTLTPPRSRRPPPSSPRPARTRSPASWSTARSASSLWLSLTFLGLLRPMADESVTLRSQRQLEQGLPQPAQGRRRDRGPAPRRRQVHHRCHDRVERQPRPAGHPGRPERAQALRLGHRRLHRLGDDVRPSLDPSAQAVADPSVAPFLHTHPAASPSSRSSTRPRSPALLSRRPRASYLARRTSWSP